MQHVDVRARWRFWNRVLLVIVGTGLLSPALHAASAEDWASLFDGANRLYRNADHRMATRLACKAVVTSIRVFGREDLRTGRSLRLLGEIYSARRRHQSALHAFRRALTIFEKHLDAHTSELVELLLLAAGAYLAIGEPNQAATMCERAQQLQESALGPAHPALADTLSMLASARAAGGQLSRAAETYQQVAMIQERALGSEHPALAETLTRAAQCYIAEGKLAKAEILQQRVERIHRHHPPAAAPLPTLPATPRPSIETQAARVKAPSTSQERSLEILAKSYTDRSEAYLTLGEYRQAAALFRDALMLYERLYGPADPKLTGVLLQHAQVLRKAGRLEEAVTWEARASSIRVETKR